MLVLAKICEETLIAKKYSNRTVIPWKQCLECLRGNLECFWPSISSHENYALASKINGQYAQLNKVCKTVSLLQFPNQKHISELEP